MLWLSSKLIMEKIQCRTESTENKARNSSNNPCSKIKEIHEGLMLLVQNNGTCTSCDAKLWLLSRGSLRIRKGECVLGGWNGGTGNSLGLLGFRYHGGWWLWLPLGEQGLVGRKQPWAAQKGESEGYGKVMLLAGNVFCFSARMWGSPLFCREFQGVALYQIVVVGLSPSASITHRTARAGQEQVRLEDKAQSHKEEVKKARMASKHRRIQWKGFQRPSLGSR